jgi:hypothetical protein
MIELSNGIASLLPIVTLLLGGMIGFLSSFLTTYLQQRNNVTAKIVEQYFKVREDICEKLSELANLGVDSNIDDTYILSIKSDMSKLYFKYYDFLPREVLIELNCLYACLSDSQNRLFKCKNNCLLPLEDSELETFIEQISLVENFRYYAMVPLKSSSDIVRKSASVNYQARSVLRALNKYFTIKDLMSWARHLPK